MKFNIRLKILTGFAFLVGLSILIQGVAFLITREYISSQISNFQHRQVYEGAGVVEKFFTEINKNSLGLAQVYQRKKTALDDSTMYVINNNDYIKKISYLSLAGRELYRYDVQGKVADDKLTFEVLTEPFFSAKSGTSAITKVYYLEQGLGPHIDLYSPIYNGQKKVEGVIKIQLSLNPLRTALSDIKIGQNGYLYIVDNEGRLLAHPKETFVLERPNLSSRNIIAAFQNNNVSNDNYEYVNEKNITVVSYAKKISGYNWLVVFEQPVAEAFEFLEFIRYIFIFTLCGSLVLLLVIAFLLSENLTRSIRSLQSSAKRVESGQLQKIEIIKSGDEIESLSYSFSTLIDLLMERERSLQNITIQLEKANKKLKELDALKNEFVSVASHELRTPMTAIKSYLWMALNGKGGDLNERQSFYIQRGYNSVDRLIRLVNDMLNISRIESGHMELTMQSVDLKKLTLEVIEEVKPKAKELGVNVFMTDNPQLKEVVADHDKVKQVFFNLVGNSLKFTPKGGHINIHFDVKQELIEVVIKDTGNGISAEDIGKLFQKFGLMPGSYTTNQTAEGTGLGLYICRTIIEHHSGKIWAASEGKGKGATFTFQLRIFSEEELKKFSESENKPPQA